MYIFKFCKLYFLKNLFFLFRLVDNDDRWFIKIKRTTATTVSTVSKLLSSSTNSLPPFATFALYASSSSAQITSLFMPAISPFALSCAQITLSFMSAIAKFLSESLNFEAQITTFAFYTSSSSSQITPSFVSTICPFNFYASSSSAQIVNSFSFTKATFIFYAWSSSASSLFLFSFFDLRDFVEFAFTVIRLGLSSSALFFHIDLYWLLSFFHGAPPFRLFVSLLPAISFCYWVLLLLPSRH